jgi:hypothetical protein
MADKGDEVRTPQYWQDRAREARTLAYFVRDQAAQDGIGRAARMYEDFAKRAVKREDAEEVAGACRGDEPHPADF